VEDVCVRSLRKSLRKYIGRKVQIGLVSSKTDHLIGTLVSVGSGLTVVRVKGRRHIVTLCEIDYFKPLLT